MHRVEGIPRLLLLTVEPEARMTDAIGTLCLYGFLIQDEDVYHMHRLVHLVISIWLVREKHEAEAREASMQH
jgi:hypothetical protein